MIVLAMIYNLIILAGTAYLVGWQGWSPWWFLLSVSILAGRGDVEGVK